MVIRVNLISWRNLFAFERERPASNGQYASKHIGKSGFSRAVLTNKAMHFTLIEVKGDMVDSVRRPKPLVNLLCMK
jgi:hypothetical protein